MQSVWRNNAVVILTLIGLVGTSCVAGQHKLLSQEQAVGLPSTAPTAALRAKVQASYSQLPLHFEANQGQSDQQVKFLSRGNGYVLFLTPTEAVLSLQKREKGEMAKGENGEDSNSPLVVLRMQLAGANLQPQIEGLDELPGRSNYFVGNDPAQWRANIPTYAKVKYHDVYPGVDLVYYGNQQQLEYDFVVAPGVDPATITLSFQDHNGQLVPVQGNNNGDVIVRLADEEVRLHKPLIYQEIDGVKQEILGQYVLLESSAAEHRTMNSARGKVGFQVAAYDVTKPLIIDPIMELDYSTYFGGTQHDYGHSIAVDATGNAYVTGHTLSGLDFPTVNAVQGAPRPVSAFVTKMSPDGATLLYSTYLGGTAAGADTIGQGIAVDTSGSAYVTGETLASNFPIFPTAPPCVVVQCSNGGGGNPRDAFVTKLSPTGSALVYSTYLGGTGVDQGYAIALDATNNAYITGATTGSFRLSNALQPIHGGSFDAFVAKINSSASALVYSIYLGGSDNDQGLGIAVDKITGDASVTGLTHSATTLAIPFPITANARQTVYGGNRDAFVSELNSSGSGLLYSTYLGGSGVDQAASIAVDAGGNAYVTGDTQSSNFPITATAWSSTRIGLQDVFITKLDPTAVGAASLVYSTYFGGTGADVGLSIAVDTIGNAYVTGMTNSTINFPIVNALSIPGGGLDAFVVKLNPAASGAASLVHSTRLGGAGTDQGEGITVDAAGTAYVAGSTIYPPVPTLPNFPVTAGARQPDPGIDNGSNNVFIAKVAFDEDDDGFSTAEGDCNDTNAAIHPGVSELCNSVDDNCNGTTDEGFAVGDSCQVGQGDCQRSGTLECTADGQSTQCSGAPGTPSPELCNGIDDDCDGAVDESLANPLTPLIQSCYSGAPGTAGVGICHAGAQTRSNGAFGACVGEVTPTAETCNGQDDNCNGSSDDGVLTTFYADADGDGFGNPAVTIQACTVSSGYVTDNGDCDDSNTNTHPTAIEICNQADDNCNGQMDESFTDLGFACGVGIGACQRNGTKICTSGGLTTKCNVTPGNPTTEVCGDGIDQDCNGGDLVCQPPLGFRVLSPNGGETWRIGTRQTVRWDPANLRGIAVVELSRNGGQTWTRIIAIDRVRATSADWVVRGPATTQARVRVIVFTVQGIFVDAGDGNFTIQP